MKHKHTVGPNPRPLSILAPQSLDPLLFLHLSKHKGDLGLFKDGTRRSAWEMIAGSARAEQVLQLCHQKQRCHLKGSTLCKNE